MEKFNDYISEIRKIIEEHPLSYSAVLRGKKHRHLYDFIMENSKELDNVKYKFITRVYWVVNSLTEFPKCKNSKCNNTLEGKNIVSINDGWRPYCSNECANLSEERISNIKSSCIRKFGVKNFFMSEEGKRIKKAWCKTHGVTNPFQLAEVNEKRRKTMIERYGHEYTTQCDELIKKCKQTCISHFGVEHQWMSDEIRKKNRNTIIDRYGTDNVFDLDCIRQKQKETFRKQRYEDFTKNKMVIPLFSCQDFISCKNPNKTIFKWKCIENGHNHEFESYIDQNNLTRFGAPARCWECHPRIAVGYSNEELEVFDFVKASTNFKVFNRDKINRSIIKGLEIDIVIPDIKVGIEFDGLYFHSYNSCANCNKNRHLIKTELAEELGWKLIHIYEDEWIFKQNIVKSRILSIIGQSISRIYARKCKVETICHSEACEFLNRNHLQGACSSSVDIGLFYNDKLVAVMTFGKARFNKKFEFELLRYASELNTTVIGGAGKLLKYFENIYSPSSIISYADRRWSTGKLYSSLGFEHLGNSTPNYFYTDKIHRFNRMLFQKHLLKTKLKNFENDKTEKENMFSNGYRIIYDCGNMIFAKYNLYT